MKQPPFLQEAGNLLNQMREIRRDLHKHPELGTQEVRTSRIVADHLKHLGLDVRTGIGGHGVVATLSGQQAGKCVALRADMDALPMEEKNTVPYASATPGVAHCCGHDAHTAILLGTCSANFRIDSRAASSSSFSPVKIRPPAVPYP
jgi:amidohydrolase